MPLTLEIVTPEALAYKCECEHVALPTEQGQIDVLPGHRPLVAMIEPGEVVAGHPGPNQMDKETPEDYRPPEAHSLAVDRGFVRVAGDVVSVLTEAAIDVADIDLSQVEDARKRAEEELNKGLESKLDPAEIEKLESVARFSIAQKLAKTRR